jgi:hypothetical protein
MPRFKLLFRLDAVRAFSKLQNQEGSAYLGNNTIADVVSRCNGYFQNLLPWVSEELMPGPPQDLQCLSVMKPLSYSIPFSPLQFSFDSRVRSISLCVEAVCKEIGPAASFLCAIQW